MSDSSKPRDYCSYLFKNAVSYIVFGSFFILAGIVALIREDYFFSSTQFTMGVLCLYLGEYFIRKPIVEIDFNQRLIKINSPFKRVSISFQDIADIEASKRKAVITSTQGQRTNLPLNVRSSAEQVSLKENLQRVSDLTHNSR